MILNGDSVPKPLPGSADPGPRYMIMLHAAIIASPKIHLLRICDRQSRPISAAGDLLVYCIALR